MTTINPATIRKLRERRSMTLDELSTKSKIDRGTINRIETGKQTSPRASTLRKLAEALRVEVSALSEEILPIEGAPTLSPKKQMNFKMADDARNALSLVAFRYNVKAADILHLAPFLFLWAAEAGLAWRQRKLDEATEAISALSRVKLSPHLSDVMTYHWRGEEIIEDERRSIAQRDLFGAQVRDESIPPEYEESEQNPFVTFLSEVAGTLGEDISFDYWTPSWGPPSYTVGTEEALELCGGDEDAAHHIVHGNAPLHEMPKDVREAGPDAIAKWANELGSASVAALVKLDNLCFGLGGKND